MSRRLADALYALNPSDRWVPWSACPWCSGWDMRCNHAGHRSVHERLTQYKWLRGDK